MPRRQLPDVRPFAYRDRGLGSGAQPLLAAAPLHGRARRGPDEAPASGADGAEGAGAGPNEAFGLTAGAIADRIRLAAGRPAAGAPTLAAAAS